MREQFASCSEDKYPMNEMSNEIRQIKWCVNIIEYTVFNKTGEKTLSYVFGAVSTPSTMLAHHWIDMSCMLGLALCTIFSVVAL